MNKKKLLTVFSVICLLFFLTGCSSNFEPITLDTTFEQMKNAEGNGIFDLILTWPLAQAINQLTEVFGSVFWSIVVVTVVINALLLAATYKSNLAMQKMQTIQPEVTKIQKKYEGRTDQQSQMRMSQELQALYKKYDINPIGSLLTTFLQFPVLIAMYSAVRRSQAVAEGMFLGHTLALTPQEAFANKAWPLIAIYVFMIIAQIVSVSLPQLLNSIRLKKEADLHHKHYEKPQQPNVAMTYGMVVFIAFIMLNWPCALSLYYVITSCVQIIKTLILNKITESQIKN